jgi:hypothetical protein
LFGVRYEVFTAVTLKNAVFRDTSEEIHYFSAAEPSRLILFKILGLHDGDYGECRLQGYFTGNPLLLGCRAKPVNSM